MTSLSADKNQNELPDTLEGIAEKLLQLPQVIDGVNILNGMLIEIASENQVPLLKRFSQEEELKVSSLTVSYTSSYLHSSSTNQGLTINNLKDAQKLLLAWIGQAKVHGLMV